MLCTELSEMIALAERLASAGEHAVLSTLFFSDGSTYRPLGSMMVSGPGSMIAGGISGGCLEEYVARHGRSLTQAHAAAMLSFHSDPDGDVAGKPLLGCGGSIEILVEGLTPDHITFLRRMADALAADTFSTAACVIDSSAEPRISVKRLWLRDRLDDLDKLKLQRLARDSVADAQSRHGVLGASRRALFYYIPPITRLVILGAGDDVRSLCALAHSLGWHVTVADRRARLATRSRFPQVDQLIAADWASAVREIVFTPRSAVVLMTHSLSDDIELLPLLSGKPMAYIGALGPEHRRRWLLEGAAETGELSEEFAARIHGPIGLNLGERSAAGIAISIASEILAHLNGRRAAPLSRPADRTPARLPSQLRVANA